jgi:TonB-dependent SusC/RagA subfamily outer membrane receptor
MPALAGSCLVLGGVQYAAAGPNNQCTTNAVAVVTADDIQRAPTRDLSDALNQLPGVASRGGLNVGVDPSSATIQLRGLNSTGLTNQPLVIIDGKRVGRNGVSINPLRDISPDDIETINILKGPSASAIYGSAAANGVLIVTTRKHERTALATESGGSLVNPAFAFDYNLSGAGYGASADICVDVGKILPYSLNLEFTGYDLSGSGSASGLDFSEGLGVTGIGAIPGFYVPSPTELVDGDFSANRRGTDFTLNVGIPVNMTVYGGTISTDTPNPLGFNNTLRLPSIGVTSIYVGGRAGTLDQQERTMFYADTPAFGMNSGWMGNYHTEFDGGYKGAFLGLGYSRTFFSKPGFSTTFSLIGTVGYDSYNFDVSERVSASGLGGAINYANSQQHAFSDGLFTSSLTASIDWQRDNFSFGTKASFDIGKVPELGRFLPDSDAFGALSPEYSLKSAPSMTFGIFAKLQFK